MGKGGKGKGKSNFKVICGNCWKLGHFKRDCPNPPRCNICHESGHMAADCPNKPKGKGKRCSKGSSWNNYSGNSYYQKRGKSYNGCKNEFKGKGANEVGERMRQGKQQRRTTNNIVRYAYIIIHIYIDAYKHIYVRQLNLYKL